MILNPNRPNLAPLKVRKERRFTGETVEQSLWQTIRTFLRTGKVVTSKFVFEEIPPDDPRYENAPYAETFIFN